MPLRRKDFIGHVRIVRDFLFDLIFPVECLGCGREGNWLCPACFRSLPPPPRQYCLNCKKPDQFGRFCPDCRTLYSLNGIWIAGDYENRLVAAMIKNLKYRLARDLAPVLGQMASLFLSRLLKASRMALADIDPGLNYGQPVKIKKTPGALLDFQNNLLITVPLHKRRQRSRGFNQAEEIGRSVAANFRLAFRANRLRRVTATRPQAKLKEKARLTNVINCFAWPGEDLKGENILLVDDVVTTGATLNECARVLKAHGAGEVWGLVIAKG